jgi:hypothetical protein
MYFVLYTNTCLLAVPYQRPFLLVSAAMSQYDTHWLHHRGIRRRQWPPSKLHGVTSKKMTIWQPITVPEQLSSELFQAQRNMVMGLDSTELAPHHSIWQMADKGCMRTRKYVHSNQIAIWRCHCNLREGVSNTKQLSGKPMLTEASPRHIIIKEVVAKVTAVSLSACLSSFFRH